jgi:hypothetical protein
LPVLGHSDRLTGSRRPSHVDRVTATESRRPSHGEMSRRPGESRRLVARGGILVSGPHVMGRRDWVTVSADGESDPFTVTESRRRVTDVHIVGRGSGIRPIGPQGSTFRVGLSVQPLENSAATAQHGCTPPMHARTHRDARAHTHTHTDTHTRVPREATPLGHSTGIAHLHPPPPPSHSYSACKLVASSIIMITCIELLNTAAPQSLSSSPSPSSTASP